MRRGGGKKNSRSIHLAELAPNQMYLMVWMPQKLDRALPVTHNRNAKYVNPPMTKLGVNVDQARFNQLIN